MNSGAKEVLNFWFDELEPAQWFQVNTATDRMITERFAVVHRQAAAGELYTWRDSAAGRLAEIIVLDQFSRNMYRDTARAFTWDTMALVLAQEAVARGAAEALATMQRAFLYMPYMHSESALIHDQAMRLFAEPGLEQQLDYEKRHRDIILRFGRYPHRNELLGRESTAEELAFLQEPGSSF